jgi:hypothetical protein
MKMGVLVTHGRVHMLHPMVTWKSSNGHVNMDVLGMEQRVRVLHGMVT